MKKDSSEIIREQTRKALSLFDEFFEINKLESQNSKCDNCGFFKKNLTYFENEGLKCEKCISDGEERLHRLHNLEK